MDTEEFCFRRRREERLAKVMANKDKYRPLMVCLSLVLCLEVRVCCVAFLHMVGVSFLHEVCLLRDSGRCAGFGHGTGHFLTRVPPRSDRMDFANPTFEKMA
jgi:hypothetical protein